MARSLVHGFASVRPICCQSISNKHYMTVEKAGLTSQKIANLGNERRGRSGDYLSKRGCHARYQIITEPRPYLRVDTSLRNGSLTSAAVDIGENSSLLAKWEQSHLLSEVFLSRGRCLLAVQVVRYRSGRRVAHTYELPVSTLNNGSGITVMRACSRLLVFGREDGRSWTQLAV